ncbi:MAG TPA: NAD(P)H-binding protein [Candidatus Limnocylindria bacterium]|nr:NAD(P)H-binding protein [Candidatus Limnocylindria bacterium]
MRVAITGGTGFVGGHLARALLADGHEVVIVSRGVDRRDESVRHAAGARFVAASSDDEDALAAAFEGCVAVAHCAGINRQIGRQTYARVHVAGTAAVVAAARRAGVRKLVYMSFLRARPDCGSAYHESKWAAEEIVRTSGLDYTVLKASVLYGRGDHLLEHLTRGFYTFPIFPLVGLRPRTMRPIVIHDLVRVMRAALVDVRLSRQTVAVVGPVELPIREAVERVAAAVGRRPLVFRLPVVLHYGFAWCFERLMTIPLVSIAQVRILSEGVSEASPPCMALPADLAPATPFSEAAIRAELPALGPFTLRDLRLFAPR